MVTRLKVGIFLIMLLAAGCNKIPSDPEKSYEKAVTEGLIVGFTPNPPWVVEGKEKVEGIESQIISSFAELNNMRVFWVKGSEQELMKKPERKEIHIVLAGLEKKTPWKSEKIGLSMPYFKKGKDKKVIAIIQGENKLLQKLEGGCMQLQLW